MAQILRFESSAMSALRWAPCVTYRVCFQRIFFAVKPLKHIGLSDVEELVHMKIHELILNR